MKRAAAIVTRRGGRTCHAAIIARELGVPAVVGCGDSLDNVSEDKRSRCRAPKAIPATSTRAHSRSRSGTIELDALPPAPVQIMMNVGNPDRAFGFAAHPESRRRARAARVHHQSNDRRSPEGIARLRTSRRRRAPRDPRADRRLPRSGHLLRRETQRRHQPNRRGVRAATRDRASFRLQVERVRESHRRSPIRAARGEPDARVSRSFALHRSVVSSVLRARVPRVAIRTRGNGAQQRADHGAVHSHAHGGRRGHEPARGERLTPRRRRFTRDHDVRVADQCPARRPLSRSTSTECPSVPTT